jgi:hypothetical protein
MQEGPSNIDLGASNPRQVSGNDPTNVAGVSGLVSLCLLTDDGTDAYKITATPISIGEEFALVKKVAGDGSAEAFVQYFKDKYNKDLTNQQTLTNEAPLVGIFNVRDDGVLIDADFFASIVFAVMKPSVKPGDPALSIVQTVKITKTVTSGTGISTSMPQESFVEGWVVGPDGKALYSDSHGTLGGLFGLNTLKDQAVKLTFAFEVGVGTYDDMVIGKDGDKPNSVAGAYSVFMDGDPMKVKWTAPNQNMKYIVSFSLDKDGKWTWKDPTADIDWSGKYNHEDE